MPSSSRHIYARIIVYTDTTTCLNGAHQQFLRGIRYHKTCDIARFNFTSCSLKFKMGSKESIKLNLSYSQQINIWISGNQIQIWQQIFPDANSPLSNLILSLNQNPTSFYFSYFNSWKPLSLSLSHFLRVI